MTYEECKVNLLLLGWEDDGNGVYWINGVANITLYALSREIAWGTMNYYPHNKQSSKHWPTYQEGIDFLGTLDETS